MPLEAKVEQLGSRRPLAVNYTLEPAEIRQAARKLRKMRTSAAERRLALAEWIVWLLMVAVAGLFFFGATQEGGADFFRWALLAVLLLLAVQAVVWAMRGAAAVPTGEWPRTQLEIYEHTVTVKLPLSNAAYSWSALANYGETRHAMVLDFNTGEAVIIPKRVITPGDLPHLRDLILRKLKHSHLRV